jgi:phosphopantothenoylcysteine decarboxylase/phosphopantothenate--cysteine ligase
MRLFPGASAAVMSAAVADYTALHPSAEKIKKTEDSFSIELSRTRDILMELGKQKKAGQVLVGFALESHNEKEYALGKLRSKNADMIVLNSLNDEGAGFGVDTNKVSIFGKDGSAVDYERKPKQQVAKDIVDSMIKLLYAQ